MPDTAEIEIDDKYSGIVNGWVEGVVPVTPGPHRVLIRAEGYVTQRLDVDVPNGSEIIITVALEPSLDLPEAEKVR